MWGGGAERKQHKKEKAHRRGGKRGGRGPCSWSSRGRRKKKSKGENWKFLASQQAPLQPSRMHKDPHQLPHRHMFDRGSVKLVRLLMFVVFFYFLFSRCFLLVLSVFVARDAHLCCTDHIYRITHVPTLYTSMRSRNRRDARRPLRSIRLLLDSGAEHCLRGTCRSTSTCSQQCLPLVALHQHRYLRD